MPSSNAESQLPAGWIQQFDEQANHPFWVDANAKPPRSIWVHPYEDEQFLNEHPDIRDRLSKPNNDGVPSEAPPPYSPRRHSFSGSTSSMSRRGSRYSESDPPTPGVTRNTTANQKHRGFFGKMKDKAIGTKEEREEAKRQQDKLMREAYERRQQQRTAMMNAYGSSSNSRYGQSMYGSSLYGPPPGNPYGYDSGLRGYGGMGGLGGRTGGFGGGGMGMGMPLLGGLAGGLILGEALDGGFGGGYGGGFGGGGFDGGGFGGGGFGW